MTNQRKKTRMIIRLMLDKNESEEEDLDIPAFIRKKMM